MTTFIDRAAAHASSRVGRRTFLLGAGSLALSGCMSTSQPPVAAALPEPEPLVTPAMYQALPEEQFAVPAVDVSQMAPEWWRTEVDYETDEASGTLVVETATKYLYHVRPNGRAVRYGIGVGRDGFSWQGRAVIAYKRVWPRWTPPSDMVARQPELRQFAASEGGANPGLNNPLGARALYIFKDGKDTLYRVHGTPDWQSVGRATSSGCVRMLNQDVIDLYERVPASAPIVVI